MYILTGMSSQKFIIIIQETKVIVTFSETGRPFLKNKEQRPAGK